MENKNYHWLILLVILFAVITAWLSFPIFFEWLITKHFLINAKDYGEKYGAVGDTYGSLNTLISSIALCAVAYSTYLQVTSLKESRITNEQQLQLAINNHQEQVRESRNSIFANQFYSLLNFKKDKLESISISRKIPFGDSGFQTIQETCVEVMDEMSSEFYGMLKKDNNLYNAFSQEELFNDFRKVAKDLKYKNISPLISYFHIYMDLCQLIKRSNISEEEKNFFKSVLSNSMTQGEQILLFWMSPMFESIVIKDSQIFTMFGHVPAFEKYALEFHEISHFRNHDWKEFFSNSENPA
ncbi:hypothetical protein ACLDZY_11950 [Acinetobacter baumannii]